MPTARGWAVAAGAVACYLFAWLLGYPEFAVLGTGCVVALATGSLALLRRVPLRVSREIAPVRVARGECAIGVVTVGNAGRFATREVVAGDRCGDTPVAIDIPRLRPGTVHTASYFLPTARRGEIPIGPLRLVGTDPLGLFRRVRGYGGSTGLLVHPRTVPLGTVPSGRTANMEGPTSDTAPSGTVTFHALREYVFGDDVRHIHWRSTARTGTVMVRHLVDSSLPRTTVLLDNRAATYPDPDDFEVAVDVAASVALAAARSGFPVAIFTADGPYLSTAGGRAEAVDMLRGLAVLELTGPADLAVMIRSLRPGRSGGSLCLVTGGTDTAVDRLAGVRDRFDRTVLVRVGGTLPPLPPGLDVASIDAADLAGFALGWQRGVGAR